MVGFQHGLKQLNFIQKISQMIYRKFLLLLLFRNFYFHSKLQLPQNAKTFYSLNDHNQSIITLLLNMIALYNMI